MDTSLTQSRPDPFFFGTARIWTKDNVENFIQYVVAAMKRDVFRSDLQSHTDSILKGIPHGSQDPDIEAELTYLMEKITFGNRMIKKPTDPRIDRTVFMKAEVSRGQGEAASAVFRVKAAALTDIEPKTKINMLSRYAEILRVVRDGGSKIAQLQVQINQTQFDTEKMVKSAFEKLFASLAEKKYDCIVSKPALDAYMARNAAKFSHLFDDQLDLAIGEVPNSSMEARMNDNSVSEVEVSGGNIAVSSIEVQMFGENVSKAEMNPVVPRLRAKSQCVCGRFDQFSGCAVSNATDLLDRQLDTSVQSDASFDREYSVEEIMGLCRTEKDEVGEKFLKRTRWQ
jgi:hypothetical protein